MCMCANSGHSTIAERPSLPLKSKEGGNSTGFFGSEREEREREGGGGGGHHSLRMLGIRSSLSLHQQQIGRLPGETGLVAMTSTVAPVLNPSEFPPVKDESNPQPYQSFAILNCHSKSRWILGGTQREGKGEKGRGLTTVERVSTGRGSVMINRVESNKRTGPKCVSVWMRRGSIKAH